MENPTDDNEKLAELVGEALTVLSPLIDEALQRGRSSAVDGLRLGIGMCARAADDFVDVVPTFTAPEHVDAVVVALRALATAMRDQSARFTLND